MGRFAFMYAFVLYKRGGTSFHGIVSRRQPFNIGTSGVHENLIVLLEKDYEKSMHFLLRFVWQKIINSKCSIRVQYLLKTVIKKVGHFSKPK